MGSWEGWTPLPDHTGATTVCVVDDDMPLRRALRRLLRSVGFAVETFGTAEDNLAAEHAPSSAPPATSAIRSTTPPSSLPSRTHWPAAHAARGRSFAPRTKVRLYPRSVRFMLWSDH